MDAVQHHFQSEVGVFFQGHGKGLFIAGDLRRFSHRRIGLRIGRRVDGEQFQRGIAAVVRGIQRQGVGAGLDFRGHQHHRLPGARHRVEGDLLIIGIQHGLSLAGGPALVDVFPGIEIFTDGVHGGTLGPGRYQVSEKGKSRPQNKFHR